MKAILKRGIVSKENVEINIGGSKSESNRLLILQRFFPNISIVNLSDSDDTLVLKNALKMNSGTVNVHHAGTAMRFLTAYYASQLNSEIILTGSERMQQRPIKILVDALKSLGADIEYLKNEGFPPIKILGKTLQKNKVSIQANVSSQYISALMLVAPSLPNGLQIMLEGKTTSIPYIEMTLSLLKRLGITAEFSNNIIKITSKNEIEQTTVTVESDWSSASYFYSLVALSQHSEIKLRSFLKDSLQGDSSLVSIYSSMGVETIFEPSENAILLKKSNSELPDSLLLELKNTPDLAQTIAVSCFGLGMGCKLTGLHTLKIKETDRLLALKNELEKLGAVVEVDDTSLTLEKSTNILPGKIIETYQDHRMAMAFAPLALKTEFTINHAEVVSKSYPNFWDDLQKAGVNCELKVWAER